jgi:hypothetical protein
MHDGCDKLTTVLLYFSDSMPALDGHPDAKHTSPSARLRRQRRVGGAWMGTTTTMHSVRSTRGLASTRTPRGLDHVTAGSMALIAKPATPPSSHHAADSARRRTAPSERYRPLAHLPAAKPVNHNASAHPPSVSTWDRRTCGNAARLPGNAFGFRKQECCAAVSSGQC